MLSTCKWISGICLGSLLCAQEITHEMKTVFKSSPATLWGRRGRREHLKILWTLPYVNTLQESGAVRCFYTIGLIYCVYNPGSTNSYHVALWDYLILLSSFSPFLKWRLWYYNFLGLWLGLRSHTCMVLRRDSKYSVNVDPYYGIEYSMGGKSQCSEVIKLAWSFPGSALGQDI